MILIEQGLNSEMLSDVRMYIVFEIEKGGVVTTHKAAYNKPIEEIIAEAAEILRGGYRFANIYLEVAIDGDETHTVILNRQLYNEIFKQKQDEKA